MINVQGKDYPDRDKWSDPTDKLEYMYSWDGYNAVLTRQYNSRLTTWETSDPNKVVQGFHEMIRGKVGLRSDPLVFQDPNKMTKSRGYNHKTIRALNNNKCQMPGCYWPEYPIVSCQIHHIVSVKEGGGEEADNKICLCPNHHAEADAGIITIPELFELNGVI